MVRGEWSNGLAAGTRRGEHLMQVCEGHGCAEPVDDINVESWELTGKILCADCVDEDFERRACSAQADTPAPEET